MFFVHVFFFLASTYGKWDEESNHLDIQKQMRMNNNKKKQEHNTRSTHAELFCANVFVVKVDA